MPFERIAAADSDAERIARLRLARTNRVGPVNFASLMLRFGSAERALQELPNLVKQTGGTFVAVPQARIDDELARAEAIGARLVLLGDSDYPALLSQVDAAPPVLWTLGPLKPHTRAVAIVGARNASAAGQKMAQILAHELGAAGFQVVSGMARGIDARAHETTLTTGTIAVLGGGIDDVYPPDNAALYQRLREQGLLVSESPVGYTAQARDFPRRNRLISGLSLGVVVVEAELRSGSLITARLALEQNREVFAVPGSPLDPRARGSNDLLRQGATLCESAEDIIRVLETQFGVFAQPSPRWPVPPLIFPTDGQDGDIAKAARRLRELAGATPVSRDELIRLAGAPVHVALSALCELEIAGLITEVEGGYVAS
ncbi:DNA protecting protein DprA [Asticcacaulis biprosthecium C19]|uniref:DNA protecting protein DprA n=1 Tax=Asticcacaulis biprosthecium C19 TaxID=715226 RepID=F4QST7_9CAUL|nr:DNA-processing protein DprA [Asticcacaulis biprosthecium]EGF89807.1 DNA protecting protein DprA [Asticcacaulis biprosthecium C19]